ncbi:NAD(P)/FAD-dependent oxidoreductase [Zymobacter palmae]|uniref:Glycine/D-amino acid oxidases n=1 Tax=Zymobacter palmae TaxID=33074 RepID=A0A348HC43_9GAMM|nr:FAD-binding oxidoreductase [Zymobacter palmae]BBG29195.1 glycine/D-amino acid oxidases [Zymobacter palmae]
MRTMRPAERSLSTQQPSRGAEKAVPLRADMGRQIAHESYYEATCQSNLAPTFALQGDTHADVCIIGGGLTGCSTALHLAQRGYDVAVLEAETFGHGASGRSGGQVITGLSAGIEHIEKVLGRDDAAHVWEMTCEAVALTGQLIEQHGIDCDFRKGYLHAANKPRHKKEQLALIEHMATRYDYHGLRWMEVDEMHRQVVTQRYIGGTWDADSGHLHPLNYTLGIAAAAQHAGARLYSDSRVIQLDESTSGDTLAARTANGRVTADFFVYAVDAYSTDLLPELASRMVRVPSHIVATAPLTEEQLAGSLPTRIAVCDAMYMLDYYRISHDNRLLLGGRQSVAEAQRRIGWLFPTLAEVPLDYYWNGLVGVTADQTPHFGLHGKNMLFAQGYSGHGMALAGLAGQLLAETIGGQAERFDLFSQFAPRRIPMARQFNDPMVAMASLFYRLKDKL